MNRDGVAHSRSMWRVCCIIWMHRQLKPLHVDGVHLTAKFSPEKAHSTALYRRSSNISDTCSSICMTVADIL